MATYHQTKAGLSGLYAPDAKSWKVISDKPGEFASAILFARKRDAERLARRNGGRLLAPLRCTSPAPREYMGAVIFRQTEPGFRLRYSARVPGVGQVSADTLAGVKALIRESRNA